MAAAISTTNHAADVIGLHTGVAGTSVPSLTDARTYHEVQLLRALHRPLVDLDDEAGYALAAAEIDGLSLLLELRDDARWQDGPRVTALELRAAVAMALARSGLADALGLDDGALALEGPLRVRIRTRVAPLLASLLQDVRFAPDVRRPDGAPRFTGAYRLDPDGLYRPRRGGGPALWPTPLPSSAAAIVAFDRGTLAATSPSMFDARPRLGARQARRWTTGLVSWLCINPRLDPALCSFGLRGAIARALHVPPEARDVLLLEPSAARAARPRLGAASVRRQDRTLVLCASSDWQSRLVAEATRRALAEVGVVDVRVEHVPRRMLGRRTLSWDFDLAIGTHPGAWGPHSMLLGDAAAIHRGSDVSVRRAIEQYLVDLAWGAPHAAEDLSRLVLETLPIVPLFRLRATYLASAPLATASLANDSFLRLERLVG